MSTVRTLWLSTHVTPTNGYKCGRKIQEDMYGRYLTGYYKFCPSCGTYMVDGVQPVANEEICNNGLL